jgi:Tfp pilus assembly protein PilF
VNVKNQLKVSRLYNAQAQKVLARCFVVGLLVGLLATQNFAQNAGDTNASSVSHSTESTGPSIAASTSGAQSSTTSIAPALPLASLSQVVVSKPANFSAFAPELTQPSASGIALSKQAAQKAIDLDSNLGEAHGLLASIAYTWDWDWPRSESEFRRAIDLGAGAETRARYGWSLATRGRFTEAHEQLRLAQDLDPLNNVAYFDEVFAYMFERNYSAEQHLLERMLQLSPDYVGSRIMQTDLDVVQHHCAEAISDAQVAAQRYPAPVTKITMAMAQACGGNRKEALRLISEPEVSTPAGFTSPYVLALVYATLDDRDSVIAQLQKSAEHHEGQILYIKYDPSFDNARTDPRFVALEKRVGLIN